VPEDGSQPAVGLGYAARALRYAQAVVAGEIIACKWTRLACERQINDLARSEADPAWPWRFDVEAAERPCLLIECLPHIKGKWSSPTIVLEDWQCFIETTVFGWVHRETGLRRFRFAYTEVPRKNAKSTLTSGNAIYMLAADSEEGAEVYSAATTGDQARIVFDASKAMLRKDSRIAAQFGIGVGEHAIWVRERSSTFKPLNAEASTQDGLNMHFGSVDELHAHKTRHLWDVMATATGSRTQPLLWAITTAGSDRSGICYEQRDYVCKLLQGVIEDDTYFGIVYTIDQDDDWTDEATWAKANPNLGVSVSIDDLRAKCRFAMQMPSAVGNFLTKHLNVWVNADSAWMDMRAWDACANQALQLQHFTGAECFEGLDLASKVDINSHVRLFERKSDGKICVFDTHWLPERAVEESFNSQYEGWKRRELLRVTPGEVVDMDAIEAEILDGCKRFAVQEVGYDPHQATQMVGHMLDAQVPMVEVRPTVLNFSEPMKTLEAWVLKGKLEHNGSPILTWMVSNVVCHRDQKDNIYPRKERAENKIDGVVALLIAVNRYLAARVEPSIDNFLQAPITA
jgi:phage terminase large subunit-like protein